MHYSTVKVIESDVSIFLSQIYLSKQYFNLPMLDGGVIYVGMFIVPNAVTEIRI